tara:strand:- start:684 stop:1115 length:432 start_codon:yes stop_codon:yes gene_type:complete
MPTKINAGHSVNWDSDKTIRVTGTAIYKNKFTAKRRMGGAVDIYVYSLTSRRGKRHLFFTEVKPFECASKYHVDVQVFLKINKVTGKPVLDDKLGVLKVMDATCRSKLVGAVDLAIHYIRAKTNSRKGDLDRAGIYKFDPVFT